MPGAGGVVATNWLANLAPKDGTAIALVSNNTPFEPLFGNKEARYDATRINWVGSPGSEIGIWGVWHASPVMHWEDARTREVTSAITGVTSGHNLYTRVLAETLSLKLKAIAGYPGQNEIYLAMERGEVDGTAYILLNSLPASRPTWVAEKKIRLIMQYGFARHPSIPDVPFAPDLVTKPEDRQFMQATFGPLVVGRPFGAPPDVPAERVEALRAAFAATMKDAGFLAEAKALKIDVDSPLSGAQLQKVVADANATPPAIAARVRALFGR
jgi:tripartite-type tricarboxylate transporter receptor subunit TctC